MFSRGSVPLLKYASIRKAFDNMVNRRSLVIFTALILLVLSTRSEARANSLTFSNVQALQDNGNVKVDLFSHPGVTLLGPTVSFLVDLNGDLPYGSSDTLQVTYRELGISPVIQTFQIPAFGLIPPPFTQLLTFTSPGANFSGVAATLTFDILATSTDFVIPSGPNGGQLMNSYTYSFNVAQPTPEPATFVLFGSALSGLAAVVRRRSLKS